MIQDPVASRYAQAAFEAAKAEGRLRDTLEQLVFIRQLVHDVPELRQFMLNPDVDPGDKVQVLDRALKGGWSDFVRAFTSMVVSLGRAEQLPAIAEAFQAMVDADEGRLRVVVRSAHPVPEASLGRLRRRLETREGKHITLDTEIAPRLIGGLQVQLGHRIIDASVQRQLAELRERLTSVKV
jgi:F-type H+-transporting ATPase subunit delta